MFISFNKSVRTQASERYVILVDGIDVGACDLHYLPNGTVAGTVIIFEGSPFGDNQIEPLLTKIDNDLLPDVCLGEHNLTFTVVRGKVIGNFEPITERRAIAE